jgi:hypothetical protein
MLGQGPMPAASERIALRFGRPAAALAAYFRGRRRVLACSLALGLLVHGLLPRPPEREVGGFRAWLGERVERGVSVTELAWEPRGGMLEELLFGRGLWFLAASHAGAPRDVYRAWVRLAPNGQPLSVRRVLAITRTPDADESGLLLQNGRLGFAAVAAGHVAAISVLEPARSAAPLAHLTARETTGALAPLERTDLVLDAKTRAAAVTLDGAVVRVELNEHEQRFGYDLERRTFVGDAVGVAHALARPIDEGAPRLELLALSRAWLGPELTALGGRAWFQLVNRARGFAQAPLTAASDRATATPTFRPLSRPLLKAPLGTDPTAGIPEPYFFRATLDAAPDRQGSPIELVALDSRQLELGVALGSAWPAPAFGVAGDGRLPRDPARYRRVVAVFNAGPEAAYARYGAMMDGRLLSPPEARHPSVVVTRSQRVSLGAWPFGDEVPADVSGFTQRRTALSATDASSTRTPTRSTRTRSRVRSYAPVASTRCRSPRVRSDLASHSRT